jgi:hypothetical protein
VELIEVLLRAVAIVLDWPLRLFRRWLDRQPHREPSQISSLHKAARLVLAAAFSLLALMPLAWLMQR